MYRLSDLNIDSKFASTLKVSIIIPAYNEEDVIIPCLESILYQTDRADEVIIVDNKSTDKTFELVQKFIAKNSDFPTNFVLVKQDKVQGLIPTRNLGFNKATGDILGRIDADAVLSRDWVKNIRLGFSDSRISGATGSVFYYDMPMRTIGRALDGAVRRTLATEGNELGYLYGTNMALTSKAWEIIKDEVCLDAEDIMHEDIDITIHLYQNNLETAYLHNALVGQSARRIGDKGKDFREYTKRFTNTFNAHNIDSIRMKFPRILLNTVYYPLHLLLKMYTPFYTKNSNKRNLIGAKEHRLLRTKRKQWKKR